MRACACARARARALARAHARARVPVHVHVHLRVLPCNNRGSRVAPINCACCSWHCRNIILLHNGSNGVRAKALLINHGVLRW
eukprot:5973888-Alexandrium_andersonii.AAC.1